MWSRVGLSAWMLVSVAGCSGDLGVVAGGGGGSSSSAVVTSGGGAHSTTVATTAGGGDDMSLYCDDGFSFAEAPLESGRANEVSFTHSDPLVFVDMAADGPGDAHLSFVGVEGSGPYTWTWSATGLVAGAWTFTFAAGDPAVAVGHCSANVIDTGRPPPPPAGCDGKLCGDDDGDGGRCQGACRLVGSQLNNPSPCGPSANDSPWQTLDNAGCVSDGGLCKIWCPYEKCSGCPNGTEAVFVPSSETSYENACKTACEALGACWDGALSLCRNPGACGTPLGQCPWQ